MAASHAFHLSEVYLQHLWALVFYHCWETMKRYVVSSGSVGATNDSTSHHCDNKKPSV